MIPPALLLLASQSPTAQAPQTQPLSVALDLWAPEDLSKELESEIRDQMEKAGVQALPEDTPNIPLLRLSTGLIAEKDGTFLARVYVLCATPEELKLLEEQHRLIRAPKTNPTHMILLKDRQEALRWLKETAVQAALGALKALPGVVLTPPPSQLGVTTEKVPGGVPSSVVGGKLVDVQFPSVKVRYLPPQPPYPALAKMARIQGMVEVELVVDAEGVPLQTRLVSGPVQLAEAALVWAFQWRFNPLMVRGEKVPSRFVLKLIYQLK